MIIKLRDKLKGDRIHTKVFMGVDEDHLELIGNLKLSIGGWQNLGCALLLGRDNMDGQIKVLFPDSSKIIEQIAEAEKEADDAL